MKISNSTICIYGASSSNIDEIYRTESYNLGKVLAQNGASIICGGGRNGLMAAITDGILDHGGNAIGVLPRFMIDKAWQHPKLSKLIVTDTMHQRKMHMASIADAAVALPGGIGTFDELFEIITWRQLGLFNKPVVLFNINSFYDSIVDLININIKKGFIASSVCNLFYVANSTHELIKYLEAWEPISNSATPSKSY